jgi:hypothetical protein
VRIFGEFDPDWEVDPTHLTIQEKLGERPGACCCCCCCCCCCWVKARDRDAGMHGCSVE